MYIRCRDCNCIYATFHVESRAAVVQIMCNPHGGRIIEKIADSGSWVRRMCPQNEDHHIEVFTDPDEMEENEMKEKYIALFEDRPRKRFIVVLEKRTPEELLFIKAIREYYT